jgi:hypothetical protein
MTPVADIIERCGGVSTVARWLGLDYSGVFRWKRVPVQHWAPLISTAREAGIEIQLDELVPDEALEAARGEDAA